MRLVGLAFLTTLAGACMFGDNAGDSGPDPDPDQPRCGDRDVDRGEGCDDGNTVSGDGCTSDCAVETANPVCGNGVREVGEACDDGNDSDDDDCSALCEVQSVCGNDVREAGESCDDGNTAAGDGCSETCEVEPSATDCDLYDQTGCPTSTPACDIADDGDTYCRAETATADDDDRCTNDTDCAVGYACVGQTDTVSICRKFCEADVDCGGNGSLCNLNLVNNDGLDLGVSVCTNACTPYPNAGCPTGTACRAYSAFDNDFTDCETTGSVADYAACTDDEQCKAGSTCEYFSGGTYYCVPYCKLNMSSCTGGMTCKAFTLDITIGATTYGYCSF